MTETPAEKVQRLAATVTKVAEGPIGKAECGCPNRVDGTPPALHICLTCGCESGRDVHRACPGCRYLAERA